MTEGMTITITNKHTKETRYDSLNDCALRRAINEQYPDLAVIGVFFCHVRTKDKESGITTHYSFDTSNDSGYNRDTFRRLQRKEIKEIRLMLKMAS